MYAFTLSFTWKSFYIYLLNGTKHNRFLSYNFRTKQRGNYLIHYAMLIFTISHQSFWQYYFIACSRGLSKNVNCKLTAKFRISQFYHGENTSSSVTAGNKHMYDCITNTSLTGYSSRDAAIRKIKLMLWIIFKRQSRIFNMQT